MNNKETFLFHDYETTGLNKLFDRPTQFAAIRTDENFEIIDEPIMLYCKSLWDCIPAPEAIALTGITPEMCESGLRESDFALKINAEMSIPNTCSLGYNNISFDDEISRNLFYRNFHNPYEREFMNKNSRFDIFNVVKFYEFMRPESLNWPVNEDGRRSRKLEDLAKANNLSLERAHDALSDVYTTIALAKKLKEYNPKMFDMLLSFRNKNFVAATFFNDEEKKPFIQIDAYAKNGFSILYPIIGDYSNKNSVLCMKLDDDESFDSLFVSTPEELSLKLYRKLEDGEIPPPITEVSINKIPMLSKISWLRPEDKERVGLNQDKLNDILNKINIIEENMEQIIFKISRAFAIKKDSFNEKLLKEPDPDAKLYMGFPSNRDKFTILRIASQDPEDIVLSNYIFDDPKYKELLFRFKARNAPDSLSEKEFSDWVDLCLNKMNGNISGSLTLRGFKVRAELIKENPNVSEEMKQSLDKLHAQLVLFSDKYNNPLKEIKTKAKTLKM